MPSSIKAPQPPVAAQVAVVICQLTPTLRVHYGSEVNCKLTVKPWAVGEKKKGKKGHTLALALRKGSSESSLSLGQVII